MCDFCVAEREREKKGLFSPLECTFFIVIFSTAAAFYDEVFFFAAYSLVDIFCGDTSNNMIFALHIERERIFAAIIFIVIVSIAAAPFQEHVTKNIR